MTSSLSLSRLIEKQARASEVTGSRRRGTVGKIEGRRTNDVSRVVVHRLSLVGCVEASRRFCRIVPDVLDVTHQVAL